MFSFLVYTLRGTWMAYVGTTFVSKVFKIMDGSDVAYVFVFSAIYQISNIPNFVTSHRGSWLKSRSFKSSNFNTVKPINLIYIISLHLPS